MGYTNKRGSPYSASFAKSMVESQSPRLRAPSVGSEAEHSTYPKALEKTHVFQSKAWKPMKYPTPSDFTVKVEESHVSVIFKPSNSDYYFGRLVDPEDIARFGPLSSPNLRYRDTGDYPSEEVAQMAHSLAVKAITNP
jgi:hypothetical protein